MPGRLHRFGAPAVLAAGVVLTAVPLLAGCSVGRPAGGGAPAPKPRVIVSGIFEEPANLNPILGPSMRFSQMVDYALYSNLFAIRPDGSLVPQLATEVPTVENGGISRDGLTYTFHLRTDAVWSDGVPFTARDVDMTWKLIMNPRVTPVSTLGFDDIQDSRILDDHTIQFTLKRVSPLFLDAWAGSFPAIIPEHVFRDIPPDQVDKAPFGHDPTVTLGPFKFQEWKAGDHITLVPDPRWYGWKQLGHGPYVDQLVFKVIPDQNAMLLAMQTGDIQEYFFAPVTQVEELQKIPGATVHFTQGPYWEHIDLNFRNPILGDPQTGRLVRQALEYGLDRSVLVREVWKGHADLIGADQPPASWAYDPSIAPYPYDRDRANRLLDQAGWTLGADGFRHKGGKTLRLVFRTTANSPWRVQSQQIDQQYWKAIGVDVVIRNTDAKTFFGKVLQSGKDGSDPSGWDLAEFEDQNGIDPDMVTFTDFNSQQTPDKGGGNFGYYANPEVDQLIAREEGLLDPAQRKAIFSQIDRILWEDMPVLFLYSPQEIDVSRGIENYRPNPWAAVNTWNVYDWKPSAP